MNHRAPRTLPGRDDAYREAKALLDKHDALYKHPARRMNQWEHDRKDVVTQMRRFKAAVAELFAAVRSYADRQPVPDTVTTYLREVYLPHTIDIENVWSAQNMLEVAFSQIHSCIDDILRETRA